MIESLKKSNLEDELFKSRGGINTDLGDDVMFIWRPKAKSWNCKELIF